MNLTKCDLCPFQSATYRFNHIYERRNFTERNSIPRDSDVDLYAVREDTFNLDLCNECFWNYTRRISELKNELKK